MSELGINSNIYQITKKYFDILSQYLIDVKMHSDNIPDISKNNVVELFEKLSDNKIYLEIIIYFIYLV